MAKTPRTWTGARTPSGLKRVRQAERRREVLQPRRSAAKTYVAKALAAVTQPTDSIDPAAALARSAERARPRGEGRRHPSERRRAPQVAAHHQGQCRHRWRGPADRWPRRQDDRQGRRGQGRQGTHRGGQGRQGQGRPDRGRQGARRAEQDRPSRGRRREGRRRVRRRVRRTGDGQGRRDRQRPHQGQGRQAGEDAGQARPRRPRRRPPKAAVKPKKTAASSSDARPSSTTIAPGHPGRFDSCAGS